jgi:hypothetical protein
VSSFSSGGKGRVAEHFGDLPSLGMDSLLAGDHRPPPALPQYHPVRSFTQAYLPGARLI